MMDFHPLSGIEVRWFCAICQLILMSPTSAVSGAPCNMDGTDSNRFPLCRKLSTENFSPMLGSDSDTSRWELHMQQGQAHQLSSAVKLNRRQGLASVVMGRAMHTVGKAFSPT